MAQVVEHILGKDEVSSSNLLSSSRKETTFVYQTKVVSFQLNPSYRTG